MGTVVSMAEFRRRKNNDDNMSVKLYLSEPPNDIQAILTRLASQIAEQQDILQNSGNVYKRELAAIEIYKLQVEARDAVNKIMKKGIHDV